MQQAELGMEAGERAVLTKRSQLSPAAKDLIAGVGLSVAESWRTC